MAHKLDFSQELIFSSSDKSVSKLISMAEKEGKLRKIAPRIYTTNLRDSTELIVRRHFFEILKWRFPDAVISHRSASELRPTQTGDFFLTGDYNKKIKEYKGFTIHIMEGRPALESDVNLGGIYASSQRTQFADNKSFLFAFFAPSLRALRLIIILFGADSDRKCAENYSLYNKNLERIGLFSFVLLLLKNYSINFLFPAKICYLCPAV